jgi:hypothetical protein
VSGDSPSTRKHDFARANRYKHTKAYKRAIRVAYRNASRRQRAANVDEVLAQLRHGRPELGRGRSTPGAPLSIEHAEVLHEALRRYGLDEKAMKSKVMTNRQTRLIKLFKDQPEYRKALDEAAANLKAQKLAKRTGIDPALASADPAVIRAAGLHQDPLEGVAQLPAKIALGGVEGALATGIAAAHDPVGVPKHTLSQLGKAAAAAPGALVDTVVHPVRTVKETVGGIEEREAQSLAERVKRIRKEGALSDITDAMIAVPGIGYAARPALAGAIRTGLLKGGLRRADRVVSGGLTVVPRERGVIGESIGALYDLHLGKRQLKSVEKALEGRGKGVDPLVREAVERNLNAGRTVAVAKTRIPRAIKLRKEIAKTRARGVFGLKHELRLRVGKAQKLIRRLNKNEDRAFYYGAVYGIRTPAQAVEDLTVLRTNIVEHRQAVGFEPQGLQKRADMLPDLDKILAAPEAHFTPRLAETLDAVTPEALRAAREDPRYELRQTNLRRYDPAAELHGLERGVVKEERLDPAFLDEQAARAKDQIAAMREGYTGPERRQVDRGRVRVAPTAEELRVLNKDTALSNEEIAIANGYYARRNLANAELPDRRERLRGPGPLEVPTRAIPGGLTEAVARLATGDIPKVENLRYADETVPQYLNRVRQTMKEKGRARPLYLRSERYADVQAPGDFAAGGGARMREDATYKGSNLRIGLQDTGTDVFIRGLARNTKAKFNKKLIDDLLNEHVFTKYNRSNDATMGQIRDALARDGVDANTVAFWNPGIYQTQLRALKDAGVNPDLHETDLDLSAFQHATDLAAADTPGWKIVPAAAMKELANELQHSSAGGRAYDIVKGNMSKMILLTGNVPWLGAQVIQNMLGGLAATHGRIAVPTNWLGAYRRWRDLPDDERTVVGGFLGLDATAADITIRRMGSHGGAITEAWRQLHDWSGWHQGLARGRRGPSISDFNPVQAMAKMDRAQNNAARILVWHTLEKKAEVKALTADAGVLGKTQARIMATLGKRDGERALRDNPDLIREHAERVVKFLGDFASLTHFERRFLGRAVMFYPFVRFSTRLAFYTLPIEHPLIGGLVGAVSNIEAEQREEMFGAGSLRWTGGKIYLGGGKAIDITKLNPIGNAAFGALTEDRPAALLGITPPFVGMLYNQASDKDYFTGAEQFYGGDPSKSYAQGFGQLSLTDPTRLRAAVSDTLSMSQAVRALQKMGINPAKGFRHDPALEEYQGVDSLPWSPRPVHFKGKGTKLAELKGAAAAENKQVADENDDWLAQILPFLPENENDAERHRQQLLQQAEEDRPKGRKKSSSNEGGFGTGNTGSGMGGTF